MKKKRNSVFQALSMISQFGINMLVPIAMCSALGYFLDKWLGTGFFFIILFFVGAAAGAWNVYKMVKTIARLDEKTDNPFTSRIEKE
ncbi:MAG: AtpZ/AtpI family protein [Lachnospiraceae bacterium]|nr:AtpZ/AtpI family protein [Lachnospiraceae bacterium]